MLPVNEIAQKGQIIVEVKGDLFIASNNYSRIINGLTPQNIYVLSDDDIKIGNWYIDDCSKVRKAVTSDREYWEVRQDYKKIIATTDSSLKLDCYQFPDFTTQCSLPSIPDDFIKKFCENNGIWEVIVEYERYVANVDENGDSIYYLKIAPDNTISIFPVKDTWNREEVCKIIYKVWYDTSTYESPMKWIEENL